MKILRSLAAALLAACLLLPLCLAGCARKKTATVDYTSDRPTAPKAEGEEPSDEFLRAAADLGLSLLRAAEGEDAVMVSPVSILCALGMTANGAVGETRAQMVRTLFGSLTLEEANAAVRYLLDRAPNAGPTTLSIADSLWFNTGSGVFAPKADFLNTNAAYYGAEIRGFDFAEGPGAVNGWVSEKTDGMIPKLFDRLLPDSVLLLVNAVLFDGKWAETYGDGDVLTRTFTSRGGGTAAREMLYSEESGYFRLGQATGFLRPYDAAADGARYSFVGILPDEGVDVFDYLASVDGSAFIKAVRSLSYGRDVHVMIPSMTFEYGTELSEFLSQSMPDAFDPEAADFSEMGTCESGKLWIGSVVHKTKLELTREGTRAAAATGVDMVTEACMPEEPVYIYLDRPFVFAIVDTDSGLPVFCGVVSALR